MSAGTIQAIGFDLDGTLFDHRGAATDGVRAFFRQLGIDATPSAVELWFAVETTEFELWRSGTISFSEQRRRRIRQVFTTLQFPFEDVPAALDGLFARYLREYEQSWRAYADVAETLDALRNRGFRLGLLTNGNEEQQLRKLEATNLSESFDVVCVSEAMGTHKPDTEAFASFARSLEVEPHRCLYIGDNPEQDIVGALRAGMRAARIERYREGAPGLLALVDSALGDTQ